MYNVLLRPFEPEDALDLHPMAVEKDNLSPSEVLSVAREWKNKGPSFSAMVEGRLVGAAGLILMWPGVAQGWVMFHSGEAQSLKREAYVVVLAELERLIEKYCIHRVQAIVRSDLEVAIKYVTNLGFRQEGILRKYDSDGHDYAMFSMIRE